MTKDEIITMISAFFSVWSFIATLIVGAVYANPNATATEQIYVFLSIGSMFISFAVLNFQMWRNR